jgi:Uncharacterised nucleotidyltransferase
MTVEPMLAGIARFGLADAADLGSVAADRWAVTLAGIVSQRLGGHAVRMVCAGTLHLTPAQSDELLERHEEQLSLDLRIERMLVNCDEILGRAGIETCVLKGPALAHRFYDDPSLRSFGDGDLLVRGADVEAAVEILRREGLHRRFQAPRASFDRRFVKAITLVAGDGLELDLHRALTPGPFGVLFDVDEIFRTRLDHLHLGGRQLRCLSPELTFVHACAHAVLGDDVPRLTPVRDVAQLLAYDLDTSAAIAWCDRFRAGVVVQRAVALVETVLGFSPTAELAEWARRVTPSRADCWRLRSYASGDNRYANQAAATFWALPRVRDRLAYASALAFPDRRYLRDRDASYVRRLTRSTSLVVRGRPR